MKLYLIRHAIAADEPRDDDPKRPLTKEGRQKFEQVVEGLDALGVRFDRLFHSPWLRAVQTAELLAPLAKGELHVSPELAEPPGRELLQALERETVAAVGHQPWLTELIALLLSGSVEGGLRYELKKGGVALLEGEPKPGAMVLRGLYSPRLLRLAGRRAS